MRVLTTHLERAAWSRGAAATCSGPDPLGDTRRTRRLRLSGSTVGALAQGWGPVSAATAAPACFRPRLTDRPEARPGERTARVLAGYRRTGGARGRGPGAVAAGRRNLAATGHDVAAAAARSEAVALERGRLDAGDRRDAPERR